MPIFDRRRSLRFPVVEIQKPTQPLATNDSSRPSRILVTTVDQVIVESLMVPFLMIVLRVLEVARHRWASPRGSDGPSIRS